MDNLDINFKIENRCNNDIILATDTGYRFKLSPIDLLSNDDKNIISLTDLNIDVISKTTNPELSCAIINEMIGINKQPEETEHDQNNQNNNS